MDHAHLISSLAAKIAAREREIELSTRELDGWKNDLEVIKRVAVEHVGPNGRVHKAAATNGHATRPLQFAEVADFNLPSAIDTVLGLFPLEVEFTVQDVVRSLRSQHPVAEIDSEAVSRILWKRAQTGRRLEVTFKGTGRQSPNRYRRRTAHSDQIGVRVNGSHGSSRTRLGDAVVAAVSEMAAETFTTIDIANSLRNSLDAVDLEPTPANVAMYLNPMVRAGTLLLVQKGFRREPAIYAKPKVTEHA